MTKRKVQMWAGFSDGVVFRDYFNTVNDGYGNIPARPIVLYPSKKLAKTRFEDVRLVEVREIQRTRNRRRG